MKFFTVIGIMVVVAAFLAGLYFAYGPVLQWFGALAWQIKVALVFGIVVPLWVVVFLFLLTLNPDNCVVYMPRMFMFFGVLPGIFMMGFIWISYEKDKASAPLKVQKLELAITDVRNELQSAQEDTDRSRQLVAEARGSVEKTTQLLAGAQWHLEQREWQKALAKADAGLSEIKTARRSLFILKEEARLLEGKKE